MQAVLCLMRCPAIDAPADPLLLSANDNNKPGQEIMKKATTIRSVETLACDAGWRNYHFVKIMTEDGIVGWSEYDEGFGAPGVTAAIERLVGARGRQERLPARADLRRTVFRDAAGRRRRGGAGARRHRERIARRQGQGARRALLRTARRKDPRPHPGLLVALRDLAHQPSRLVQARDHRSRWRQVDRSRGARKSALPR